MRACVRESVGIHGGEVRAVERTSECMARRVRLSLSVPRLINAYTHPPCMYAISWFLTALPSDDKEELRAKIRQRSVCTDSSPHFAHFQAEGEREGGAGDGLDHSLVSRHFAGRVGSLVRHPRTPLRATCRRSTVHFCPRAVYFHHTCVYIDTSCIYTYIFFPFRLPSSHLLLLDSFARVVDTTRACRSV